ncbi:MAG: aldolase/citrate lyase family protein [Bacteroidales bacterium]
MKKRGIAGNSGENIRSDCKIELTLNEVGKIKITLNSKVDSMYGESIRALVKEILEFYDIDHAEVSVEDSGALSHVIAARLEAAVKQVSNSRKGFLLPPVVTDLSPSTKERFRMSRLYLPGNNPAMMINAGIHEPDGIILDLEDSVAAEKKDEARILVRNALRNINFYGAERMVRINQLPLGLEDASAVVPHGIDLLLIPKCEEVWQVHEVEKVVKSALSGTSADKQVFLMPIIESALGVENAFQIATASKQVVAMAIGLEDFTADLGVPRSDEGRESLFARTRIVNACKAARIQPIDSVYSDVGNMDGLLENVKQSAALGFEGMGCIHPGQIRVIHEGFKPSSKEVERAKQIIEAFEEAAKKGLGVVSLGSKMIDPPVVKRAERTMLLAAKYNMI